LHLNLSVIIQGAVMRVCPSKDGRNFLLKPDLEQSIT